jgi:hypothetical protein
VSGVRFLPDTRHPTPDTFSYTANRTLGLIVALMWALFT